MSPCGDEETVWREPRIRSSERESHWHGQSRSASLRRWHKVRSGQKGGNKAQPLHEGPKAAMSGFSSFHVGRKECRSSWAWDYKSVVSFLLTHQYQITIDVINKVSIREKENWKFPTKKASELCPFLGKRMSFSFLPFFLLSFLSPFLILPSTVFFPPSLLSFLFLPSFLPQTYLLSISHELRLFWNLQIQHFTVSKTPFLCF